MLRIVRTAAVAIGIVAWIAGAGAGEFDPGTAPGHVEEPKIGASGGHGFRSVVLHVPSEYGTIQEAIDATSNGDVVEIADGTYTGAGNRDLDFGGKAIAVRSASGDPTLCIIDCEGSGRGFYFHNGEGPDAVVAGLTITNGNAAVGSGVCCEGVSSPTLTNCTLSGNRSTIGGGIFCWQDSNPTLVNCTVSANMAIFNGGGVYCYDSSPTLTNCTISENTTHEWGGGGVHCEGDSSATLTNCTVSRNTAFDSEWHIGGGGVLCEDSSPTLTNCILWGNSPQAIRILYSGSPVVTYCDVQGGWPGEGNIDADPLFDDPDGPDDNPDTWEDNSYRLGAGSPCIDAANNTAVPPDTFDLDNDRDTTEPLPFDLDGNLRFVDDPLTADSGLGTPPIVDMGAYEYRDTVLSVPDEYATIQAAIDVAFDGDLVEIADGTYTGTGNKDLDFGGKAITVRSASGDPTLCVIDCEGSGRGFYFHSDEGAGSMVVGLTVTNGYVDDASPGGAVGGGVYCVISNPTLANCRIGGNTAGSTGGGVCMVGSEPTLINCQISGNTAHFIGGGINIYYSMPTLVNCVISRNTADDQGGGVYCFEGRGRLVNCILWDNIPQAIYVEHVDPEVTYCDVQGGWFGEGNIDADPMFVDPDGPDDDPATWEDNDYRLASGSPCIDAADNMAVPSDTPDLDGDGDSIERIPFDLDGNPRFADDESTVDTGHGTPPIVDMGAYEYNDTVLRVPEEYETIQSAIDAAQDGYVVEIADGTYTGPGNKDLDFNGKAITVRSVSRDPTPCIIDCEGNGRGFYFHSGEGPDSIVEGLTIANGYVDYEYSPGGDRGGGVYCSGSSPTLINCAIVGNSVELTGGGGVYCAGASEPTLTDCSISGNSADYGGGVWCVDSSPTFTNCTISGNRYGGGVECNAGSSPTLTNCTINGNEGSYGGGISCHGGNPTLNNCAITGNSAWSRGGAVYCYGGSPALNNCTIVGNSALSRGGAVNLDFDSSPMLTNCILWGDAPEEIYVESGSPVVTYCDVQGGWPGAGNIDADPLFVDPDGGDGDPATWQDNDFRLGAGSPCIDAADNAGVPPDATDLDGDGDTDEPAPFDLDGNPRFVDDPYTEDTGHGDPPIVDMGAYEFQGCQSSASCPSADVNCDDIADGFDVAVVRAPANWLMSPAEADEPRADVNGDGLIDGFDIAVIRSTACWLR